MRSVTHQFAHFETLARAQRWLVQLGFRPDQIEVHTDGTPRLAVLVPDDRRAEVELLINAAERADPQGWPSFWDLAKLPHDYSIVPDPSALVSADRDPRRETPISWTSPDARPVSFDAAPIREGTDVDIRFT